MFSLHLPKTHPASPNLSNPPPTTHNSTTPTLHHSKTPPPRPGVAQRSRINPPTTQLLTTQLLNYSTIHHPPLQSTLTQLAESATAAGFSVETFGHAGGQPLLGLTRPASGPDATDRHIYLSAGIHGDEPAGPQALLELLADDALPRRHHYSLCPLLNPTGLARGTRENADGIDLNRDYRHFRSEEITAHARWIEQKVRRITCALHLHEDWESRGFYLYELNFTGRPGLSGRIMQAVRQHLPIDPAEQIDGRPARDGIIRPDHLPELDEGDPEAIYLHKRYGGLNYTLETPSALDFRLRVQALKAAVRAIV